MKYIHSCTMAAIVIASLSYININAQGRLPQLGFSPVEEVVAAMTLEEKARFLIGNGMTDPDSGNGVIGRTDLLVPGAAGTTYPIPRLGIPAIVFADGPAGVRIDTKREGDSNNYNCTHFPMASLISASWNDSLAYNIGRAIGNEALEYGVDIMLAPALNIQRHPLCGRNYEYYSEDPVLSGRMAASYVSGIQDNGVGACVKHFAANNQETNRKANESIVSQRALREIYLKGFEYAIKESQPWTVMSSYNYLNGLYTSENPELLDSLLRQEWSYDGVVVSDWFGGTDAVAQMKAGNELLQPGYNREYDEILAALRDGTLDQGIIDRNISRVLNLILKTPRFKGYKYSKHPDLQSHARLCRKSAAEGMVLLKNSSSTLPFGNNIESVALFGNNSYDLIPGGSGSGDVNRSYNVNLSDGLANRGIIADSNLNRKYTRHIEKERIRIAKEDKTFRMVARQRPSELKISRKEITRAAENNDAAILTIGFSAGEFADRPSDSFFLNPVISENLTNICDEFHKRNKPVIVVLNTGGVIETASWKELPDAILCAWQSGQEGGNTIADILWGDSYPSGKLPMTFPVSYADHASNKNFPVDIDAGIIFGANTRKHTRDKRNIDHTIYEEDIYVGYRYFDSFGVDVSYPFGYGLGYTDFKYSDFDVHGNGSEYTATVKITNIGKYPGKEIVQLYYSAPANIERPQKELLTYAKTRELEPGESEIVKMRFDSRGLAFFDEGKSAWLTPAGAYTVYVTSSSRDIRDQQLIGVNRDIWPVKNILAPSLPIEKLNRQEDVRPHFALYDQRASLFETLPVDNDDIVMLGNSITHFCEWHELLGNPNIKNRGISGDSFRGVLQRLNPILEGKPAKIFLLIGINDIGAGYSVQDIADGINKICTRIREESPATELYLQSVLPVNDEFLQYTSHTSRFRDISYLNSLIKAIADDLDISYIDLYSHFVDPATDKLSPIYTNDGLHLLSNAYQKWAEILRPYIIEH